MRQLFIMIVLLFVMKSSFCQTSVYHPFPDSNATWFCGHFNYGSWMSWAESYHLSGEDTTIGNYTYKKLYDGSSFYGGIRQDIPNKTVYIYHYGSEDLLFDFSAAVNDTIITVVYCCSNTTIITGIDSVFIGNSYRKRFHITDGIGPCNEMVIEGIGCTSGLMGQKCFEIFSTLCQYQDDSITYVYPPYQSSCVVGLNEDTNQRISCSLHPNPFSTLVTLQTNIPLMNATLTLNNCLGKAVMQIEKINGQTLTFSRSNLPGGLYFVRLTQDNKIVTSQKLIITD